MKHSRVLAAASILALAVLIGCGDDTPSTPTPPPPAPVVPSAAVDVTGNGNIAIHPSAVATHMFAIEFPLELRETSGGTAIWNFARVSLLQNGVQIERSELGATDIREAGYRDIAANSTTAVRAILRFNRSDFDDLIFLLGFIDNKDGRKFEVSVDGPSFDGIVIDVTPAVIP